MIDGVFESQRRAFQANPNPAAKERQGNLDIICGILSDNAEQIAHAISQDFGHRSRHETRLLEIFPTLEDARHARKHVGKWMKSERVSAGLWFQPARARILKQPLGVIGIVAPWNYPIDLSIGPLVAALAAGNRAMVKMSELSPNTGALLAKVFGEQMNQDLVAFINGGVDVAKAMTAKPFDHLLFTGSTAVGRSVMHAASDNLTPVTLELGGKSPVVVAPGYDIEKAARRVMLGKCLNAGQTCIAPDYVLLPSAQIDAFCDAALHVVSEFYPSGVTTDDYTSIVSDHHFTRLQEWLREAADGGARISRAGDDVVGARKMTPAIVRDAPLASHVMQEEIFGPILPLVAYDSLDDALRFVSERPRPLAMYYFDDDATRTARVLATSMAGGVTVNDTMFHFAQHGLPFGGVGASGMGSYHGVHGFNTFTKQKGVFYQSRINAGSWLTPPFGRRIERLLKFVIGK